MGQNLIKGFVEIERRKCEIEASRELRTQRQLEEKECRFVFETEKGYKQNVARILFSLLKSYGGMAREVYVDSNGFDSADAYSSLCIEPPQSEDEYKMVYSSQTATEFTKYHSSNGWNKILKLDELLQDDDLIPAIEYSFGAPKYVDDIGSESETVYADEKDAIHWERNLNRERKHIQVYLLKFFNFQWFSKDFIAVKNGVFFADRNTQDSDTDVLYSKIKDLVAHLSGIVHNRNRKFTARVKWRGVVEQYVLNSENQFVWVQNQTP